MEQTLKKKTKHLIALRTNNFIQTEIQKQIFFNQVLQAIQNQFQPKQYQFLTTYLLSQQNTNHKRMKYDFKNQTQKKINTLPNQRPFNLSQIDVNLFQQNTIKPNNFLFKKTSINTKQIDFQCTNTPKGKIKKLIFQNKKILDLDRKLHAKYQNEKNKLGYKHNFLLTEGNQIKKDKRFLIKTSYKKHYSKKKTSKHEQNQPRLKTRQNYSRHENFATNDYEFLKKNNNFRRSQFNLTQRQKNNQDFVPKYFIKENILNKKQLQLNKDFSDIRMSIQYRNCFS